MQHMARHGLMHAQSKAGKQSLLPRINQANWIFWKILYSTPEATTLTSQITYIHIYIYFLKSLSATLTRKTTHAQSRKSILATLTRKTALLDQIHRQQTHATYGQTWVDACTKQNKAAILTRRRTNSSQLDLLEDPVLNSCRSNNIHKPEFIEHESNTDQNRNSAKRQIHEAHKSTCTTWPDKD